MRGLKHQVPYIFVDSKESHLLQMRGLKQKERNNIWKQGGVASFTDAWIETWRLCDVEGNNIVASFTDAWIETGGVSKLRNIIKSHLLQMRGLKPSTTSSGQSPLESHLLQMRGLKQFESYHGCCYVCRIFYRCVDWNISTCQLRLYYQVASFTDAWIETSTWKRIPFLFTVASFTDAWIETLLKPIVILFMQSHLLQMRGLKPEKPSLNLRACLVASFTDAWIETVRTWERRMKNEVASFTDAWIETVNAF